MCNVNKSAKKKKIISLVVWARENMRACIVLEIMMSCTGFCLTSVLVQSVCDAWRGEQREGMALWFVGVDFLCGTVGLQLDIFSTHMFCFFVVFVSLSCQFDLTIDKE